MEFELCAEINSTIECPYQRSNMCQPIAKCTMVGYEEGKGDLEIDKGMVERRE